MKSARKNHTMPALIAVALVGAAAVAAWIFVKLEQQRRAPLPEFSRVGQFQFTERSERPVTQADIAGKIVVVDFFFASCSVECQVLGQRMREVQRLTAGMDDVLLLSLTVDPKSDTPKVLRRLADQLAASTNRWFFLTGEKTNLYPFIQERFLLAAGEPDTTTETGFIHSSKIALVDGHGVVRGYYDGLAALAPNWILRDINKLRREATPAPTGP
jgi:protein SCO1/2